MPFKFVFVRASFSSSPTVTPFSSTHRIQFDHITSEVSHGPRLGPAANLWFVVRLGICCSNSLSNSIVNATSTWDSSRWQGRMAACRVHAIANFALFSDAGIELCSSRPHSVQRGSQPIDFRASISALRLLSHRALASACRFFRSRIKTRTSAARTARLIVTASVTSPCPSTTAKILRPYVAPRYARMQ
jgi:hypothetical protein